MRRGDAAGDRRGEDSTEKQQPRLFARGTFPPRIRDDARGDGPDMSHSGRSNSHTATSKANFSHVMRGPAQAFLATFVSPLNVGSQATGACRAWASQPRDGTLFRATLTGASRDRRLIRPRYRTHSCPTLNRARRRCRRSPRDIGAGPTLAVRLMLGDIATLECPCLNS